MHTNHHISYPFGNFGDDLNLWLWPQILPKPIEECFDQETQFLGIGTILNHKITPEPPKKVIFGSGHGYGDLPLVTPDWRFFCVRGPLTAEKLNLPAHLAITDSAALLRMLVEPRSGAPAGPSFMPHHRGAVIVDWKAICDQVGLRYIDPLGDVEPTLEAIRNSSYVIAEAMHGAIVADALRVPWIAVKSSRWVLDFKWQDWTRSLELECSFDSLPLPGMPRTDADGFKRRLKYTVRDAALRARLRWIMRFGRRKLSRDQVFEETSGRLQDALQEMIEAA